MAKRERGGGYDVGGRSHCAKDALKLADKTNRVSRASVQPHLLLKCVCVCVCGVCVCVCVRACVRAVLHICSCGGKDELKAIHPEGTSHHTRLFRGTSTHG
jgi:hypothetical protein